MKESILRRYAALIARRGVNLQKGQDAVVQAALDQPRFVELLVEELYSAGAGRVFVEWSHQPITRLGIDHMSKKRLSTLESFELAKLRHRLRTLPAMIYLLSEDPDGLAGVDQRKYGEAMQKRGKKIKPIRDQMENKYQWCIAAVPGDAWAKKLFPQLSRAAREEALWRAILEASRADSADPIAAWDAHNARLHARCDYLNSLSLRELHYTSKNGTDLTVGLIPDALFMGGSEPLLTTGIIYNPNIPSEEIFTTPMRGKAEGIVYSSKPLSFRGALIEGFSVRFEKGRAVEVHAESGEALLSELIGTDEGAAMLGEVALVPYHSPISMQNILYYNTLFDENAACHLAFGMGFSNCIKNYEGYTLAECREKGVNDSILHEDFMIGTSDLSIDGVTASGETVAIFRNGDWAKELPV